MLYLCLFTFWEFFKAFLKFWSSLLLLTANDKKMTVNTWVNITTAMRHMIHTVISRYATSYSCLVFSVTLTSPFFLEAKQFCLLISALKITSFETKSISCQKILIFFQSSKKHFVFKESSTTVVLKNKFLLSNFSARRISEHEHLKNYGACVSWFPLLLCTVLWLPVYLTSWWHLYRHIGHRSISAESPSLF